ncbi:MAG: hypothetical protein AAB573_01000 [Patescibacteria group bacterium]
MIKHASVMHLINSLVVASSVLVFFIIPMAVHAANLGTLTSVAHGGRTLLQGDAVYRSDFSSISNNWQFNFSWPSSVANTNAMLAIVRGTFGNIEGGVPQNGVNYSANFQVWPAGNNSISKSINLPPLGGLTPQSGTYTALVASTNGTFNSAGTMEWFASGGTSGVAPSDFSLITFDYHADDVIVELPDAIRDVTIGGRVITDGEQVFRKELAPLNGSTDNYWTFDFDWPDAVPNQQALFMIFRGTYGSVEGGVPQNGVNYGATVQVWPAGHNEFGKFINLPPLKHASTTESTYTVMIAERDPKFLAEGLEQQALWFSSGGTQGIPPRKYSTLTFEYKIYEECCSSVVFLPGMQGSILNADGNTIWPVTLGDVASDLNALALNTDGTPVTPNVTVAGVLNTAVMGPLSIPIYQELSDFMSSIVTAGTIKEWVPLAYDWRYSPEHILTHGVLTSSGIVDLTQRIEQVAENSDTGKVTIVGHSMGGLMGKALIKKLVDSGRGDLIDNFVMVGSPQLGTPQTVAALLHGEKAGLGDLGFLNLAIITKAEGRALGRNLESAYNLLPSEQYDAAVIDPTVVFDTVTPLTQQWRDSWGIGLTTFNELFEFLSGNLLGIQVRTRPAFGDVHLPEVLREDLLTSAALFHQEFDNFVYPAGVRVVQIAGWGLPTIKGIEYVESHNKLDYKPRLTVEGDETVVYASAVSSNADTYYFNLAVYNALDDTPDFRHTDLLSAPPIRNALELLFSGEQVLSNTYLTTSKPFPEDVGDKLLVSVHSPVAIGAYDSRGNFTGVTPNQSSSDAQMYVEEIPGSQYLTFGDGKYILLPEGGQYSFVFEGTGTGEATIDVQTYSNDVVMPVATYSNISVTDATSAAFVVTAQASSPNLDIDQNGDGQIDAVVMPDGTAISIEQVIASLKTATQSLSITEKLKTNLLKRIASIEKKVQKQKEKQSKVLANLTVQISKKAGKGLIDSASATELTIIVDELVAGSSSVPISPELIANLENKINSLIVPTNLKNSLIKKVERIKNTAQISRSVAGMTAVVTKKNVTGKMSDADAQALINLLTQLEGAL